MFTQAKKILQKAKKEKYAVGAFAVFNLETVQAVVRGATVKKSPLIILVSPKTIEYSGAEATVLIVKSVIKKEAKNIPVALLLDHGKNIKIIKEAIDAGFSSVMFDGSLLPFKKNISLTKKVVDYAHKKRVDVQGELGGVPYLKKNQKKVNLPAGRHGWNELMTDPEKVQEFVKKTNVDTLAVAIGNAHGFFKERARLDWKRLEKIHQKINLSLVLHGASDFKYKNVPKAVKNGVACFNIDTALKTTFSNSLKKFIKNNPNVYDPRIIFDSVKKAVQKKVEEKIEAFGSKGKA